MKSYADQLQSLLKQIPDTVAEEDLPQLEAAATGFQHVLKRVHHHESGSGINTHYFYQHLKDIESALYNAQYGNDQKQRNASFKKAKKERASGIEGLVRFVNRHTNSSFL